jgi:nucleoside triphosphate diphosphatase
MQPSRDIGRLIDIMARLRDPQTGCPWDVEQDFASIAPFTVEEAYEVTDAIARGDRADLRDELGDLLLQVVFHARMAEEEGSFDFGAVVEAITAKLIRRHPHVFGAEADGSLADAGGVRQTWEAIKADERQAKAATEKPAGALDGVSVALPGLTRALKLQARAARVGFDWNDAALVLDKLIEEVAEVTDAVEDGGRAECEEEIGDLLFTAVNLARHLDIDPESAMRRANAKFETRFRAIEAALAAEGRSPESSTLAEMEELWQAVKGRATDA